MLALHWAGTQTQKHGHFQGQPQIILEMSGQAASVLCIILSTGRPWLDVWLV